MTRGFELVTCGFELVTREFELLTRGFGLITREFELETRGSELALLNFYSSFKLSTRASNFQLVTRNPQLVTCNS